MAAKVIDVDRPAIMAVSRDDMMRVFVTGLVIGIISVALFSLLERYVFDPALCNPSASIPERCSLKEGYASGFATALSAIIGLFAMVKLRIYRPFLVVLFVSISLWGVLGQTSTFSWWVSTFVLALLFAVAYTVFTWLVRIRQLVAAIIASTVLVVAVRLATMI